MGVEIVLAGTWVRSVVHHVSPRMNLAPVPTIERLSSSNARAAAELIRRGLTERWGCYKPELNPDLDNLERSYRDAEFLIVRVGQQIVGCGALVRESDDVARIVRMSVETGNRRAGIGSQVLRALLTAARTAGFSKVVVETTASWSSAVSFYLKHGFTLLEERDGDCHFSLHLLAA
jgi:GNAT superfamily N-acetyltransferase